MSGAVLIFKNRKSCNGTNVEATLAEISHREDRGSTRTRTTTAETPTLTDSEKERATMQILKKKKWSIGNCE